MKSFKRNFSDAEEEARVAGYLLLGSQLPGSGSLGLAMGSMAGCVLFVLNQTLTGPSHSKATRRPHDLRELKSLCSYLTVLGTDGDTYMDLR